MNNCKKRTCLSHTHTYTHTYTIFIQNVLSEKALLKFDGKCAFFCLAVEIISCFNALMLDGDNECVSSVVLAAEKVSKTIEGEREINKKLEKKKLNTFTFRERLI